MCWTPILDGINRGICTKPLKNVTVGRIIGTKSMCQELFDFPFMAGSYSLFTRKCLCAPPNSRNLATPLNSNIILCLTMNLEISFHYHSGHSYRHSSLDSRRRCDNIPHFRQCKHPELRTLRSTFCDRTQLRRDESHREVQYNLAPHQRLKSSA